MPNAPTVTTTGLYQSISVSWTNESGSGAIAYVVQWGQGAAFEQIINDPNTTSFTITGLANSTTYNVRVGSLTVNVVFNVSWSPYIPTTTLSTQGIPSVPTNLVATSNQNAKVPLSWNAPFSDGGHSIQNYIIQQSSDQMNWNNVLLAPSSPAIVSPLPNGTLCYFRVYAINSIGPGPYSAIASATPSTVPSVPTNLVATSNQNAQVPLSWNAPSDNGGIQIDYYVVQYGTDPNFGTYNTLVPNPTTTLAIVSGLINGTLYYFKVLAHNTNGIGASVSTSATPSTVPSAPTNLVATPNQNAQVPLSWNAPSDNGGIQIDYYVVQYGTDPNFGTYNNLVPNPTTTSATVSGLINGTLYYFKVLAHNTNGIGASVSTSATPSTVPSAPTGLAAVSNQNAQVPLSWNIPSSDGGLSITDYKIQYKEFNTVAWNTFIHSPSTTTPINVGVLTNGTTYNFRVAAINSNPNSPGPYSAVVSATPSTVPDAPVNLKVVPGNAQVHLSWSAGPSSGGAPITNFKIEYKLNTTLVPPGQWSFQYSMTTTTIYFLKNGSLYNFRVSAINASGPSLPSATVNATPFAPLTTSCGITNFVPGPPPWSRAGGNNCPNCDSNYGYAACGTNGAPYSTYALDQRRKAEILKYRSNSSQLSPALFYSMISRNAFTRKKSWATQTQTYTNPNVNNLPEIENASGPVALQCNQPQVLCSLSSGSDVPGPVIPLCIDESVPLYNYKMQVSYSSGGKTSNSGLFEEFDKPPPIPTPMPTPTPTPTSSPTPTPTSSPTPTPTSTPMQPSLTWPTSASLSVSDAGDSGNAVWSSPGVITFTTEGGGNINGIPFPNSNSTGTIHISPYDTSVITGGASPSQGSPNMGTFSLLLFNHLLGVGQVGVSITQDAVDGFSSGSATLLVIINLVFPPDPGPF